MKRMTTLLACLTIATASTFAQTEAPRGLYKLQRLGYEKGQPDHVPEMEQYKYCSESHPLTLMVYLNTPAEYRYAIRPDEPHPYTYTGDIPVGEDGHGTRIYDSDSTHFTLKWYNTIRPGGKVFPLNEFITEYYDRKDMMPQMERSVKMLEMKHEQPTHRFAGCWRMVGNYGTVDGERILVRPRTDLYKVYGEQDVTFLFCSLDHFDGGKVVYMPLIVKSDTCIKEGDNGECTITWKDADTFTLKFDRGDGTIVEELWKRSGLNLIFQKIFGTNLPMVEIQIPAAF